MAEGTGFQQEAGGRPCPFRVVFRPFSRAAGVGVEIRLETDKGTIRGEKSAQLAKGSQFGLEEFPEAGVQTEQRVGQPGMPEILKQLRDESGPPPVVGPVRAAQGPKQPSDDFSIRRALHRCIVETPRLSPVGEDGRLHGFPQRIGHFGRQPRGSSLRGEIDFGGGRRAVQRKRQSQERHGVRRSAAGHGRQGHSRNSAEQSPDASGQPFRSHALPSESQRWSRNNAPSRRFAQSAAN